MNGELVFFDWQCRAQHWTGWVTAQQLFPSCWWKDAGLLPGNFVSSVMKGFLRLQDVWWGNTKNLHGELKGKFFSFKKVRVDRSSTTWLKGRYAGFSGALLWMAPVAMGTNLEKGNQMKREVLTRAGLTNFGVITLISRGVCRTPGISIKWYSNAQVTGFSGMC